MTRLAQTMPRPSASAARSLAPGLAMATLVALAAQFLSEHYGAPAMLMALLLGISLNFLGEEERTRPGIRFGAQSVLRIGVALLGARISVELLMELGLPLILLVVCGTFLTILFGILLARVLNEDWQFGLLTAGSVAICGASAAMAIGAILPRDRVPEQRLIFTVLGVTLLSTIAMIVYPILASMLGLDTLHAGIFLGGTIHDVAQVVGAGFSISDETGDTATLVKLIRVTMLAPVVLMGAIVVRRSGGAVSSDKRPPLMPMFVIGFLVLAAVNSLGWLPQVASDAATLASRWFLLIAIAAVGMKTSIKDVLQVGGVAISMIVAETLFIALFILGGLEILHVGAS
ncbi:MAG: putative sulfate exporter family transporter [Rhodobacteraceae bacterium]|nr:putative sulfate exporter family transporter [Paracoccaceae bacterium]MAY43946.1 putative sulfate exporter family transporter [Paracoccaceae bacterium]